ncbi:MAG: hypothetical protein JRJ87_27420 [Deltaproteobacteria bacterium]|nr:hypothetical protein [Deltaproteobacteria bacterium]
MKLTQDELLDVYKTTVQEMHNFLRGHQTRVNFFMGILSVVFAGTVAGVFKASSWYHVAFLTIGPVIIIALAQIAINGVFRLYQQFLEIVTVRAKLEQVLGLTEPPEKLSATMDTYWQGEPILAARHLKSRCEYPSSEKWLDHHRNLGYHRWTRQLFRGTQLVGCLLLLGLIALAYLAYTGKVVLSSS